jgi:predicted transcriptional regulator of viral defense system
MNRLAEMIVEAGLAERILTEGQIARLLGGSRERRYSMLKRALQSGALVRIRRGCYVLTAKYRKHAVHPFAIAQAVVPGSYISMESALAFHGWTPEAVHTTISVTPGRKRDALSHVSLGQFNFVPLAIQEFRFLEGVERHVIDAQAMLIAKPLRALLDLVALRKLRWVGVEAIADGLRVDLELVTDAALRDFATLDAVYKHRAVRTYASQLSGVVRELSSVRSI